MNGSTRNFLIFIAVLSLLFVMGDIFLWVNLTNEYNNPEVLKETYLQKYPSEVRNVRGLTILPLILLTFASLVFIRAAKTNFFKMTGAIIAAILAIVIIWKMFTLYS
jgi:hypothetical protein